MAVTLSLSIGPATAAASTSTQASASVQPVTTSAQANELAVVKAELAASQHFQEQILTTVYWSLGTIAGLAVLLVGYGWWTNFRIYDRDKQALEKELRTLVAQEARRLIDDHRTHTESQITSASASLNDAVKSAEVRLAASLKELVNHTQKQTTTQISQLKDSQSDLLGDVRRLQLSEELKDRLLDRERNTFRNALQGSVSALELAVKLHDEYEISNVLDLVAEDVASILGGKDRPIDNFLIGQLVEVLDSIKGSHAHAAAALKAKAPLLLST